jgi:hypothetical protein
MRFLITARPGPETKQSPADTFDQELFVAYMRFNEEMQKAGVLVAAEGLAPSGGRARIEVREGRRVAVDGPFAETKKLVGGFYLIEVASKEEAVAWALECPSGLGFDDVLDVYQLTGESDLPKELVELTARVAPTWFATFAKK